VIGDKNKENCSTDQQMQQQASSSFFRQIIDESAQFFLKSGTFL
jgi:hypothetical protein